MEKKEISTVKINQTQPGSYPTYTTAPPIPGLPSGYPDPPPPYTPSPSYEPIVTQPQPVHQNERNWMPVPVPTSAPTSIHMPPACLPPPCSPQGIEYLSMVDQILVHQKIELLEAFTDFETKNKYLVKNSLGQDVYYAIEDSNCCTRNCCGAFRPFGMKIFDNHKTEVMHLYRPLACQSCCFPCCLQSMEVSAPPGNVIGSVKQEWSVLHPTFAVKNAHGDTVLRIKGPFLTCSCGGDVDFVITRGDGEEVGKITKQWSGIGREAFTDADFFGINFPMDLDVKMKAVLLGGLFLIDMMFYERTADEHRSRR